MEKSIKNKSVSFNVADPFQRQMKEYTEQYPNFSGYVKRLIQRDMEDGRKKAPKQVVSNQSFDALKGVVLERGNRLGI